MHRDYRVHCSTFACNLYISEDHLLNALASEKKVSVCVSVCVCVYVHVCACVCVCMCVCVCACTCACVHVLHICLCVRMYVFACVFSKFPILLHTSDIHLLSAMASEMEVCVLVCVHMWDITVCAWMKSVCIMFAAN